MYLVVFSAILFISFLFKSIGIVQIRNHIQSLFLLLFGSKDSVRKHNIYHEDAKRHGNFYGVPDVDHDGKLFAHKNVGEQEQKVSGLEYVFTLVVIGLVIAAILFKVFNDKRERHRKGDTEGKSIGKLFVSVKEIAKGSNGTVVFEGTYEGRKVAVKRLVKAHHDVAYTEIQNLIASDQHPNIVRWYGWEYDHDFVYLSLERCACSLDDLILNKMYSESFQLWRPNGYPSPVLLKLMRDIIVGLVHLHDLGIVHRDLKPHNVLIVKGKGLCGKLSDMGISRRLTGDMTSLGPQATGSGSSGWQAPEQLRLGRQTRAVDIFSLGCVFFFCMTRGRHPFGDHLERDINVTRNKVNLFLVKHIPEAMDLFSRLLNPNPELRPKASEVLHHPMFWNSETRMSFLRDTSDWVESKGRKDGSIVLTTLENKGPIVLCGKWNVKMDPSFISHILRYRSYSYKSVRDLLRLIRNTLNHYRNFPKEVQVLLGSVPEGTDDYFRSRFPKLLTEVYNVIHHHCKKEDWFRKYMEN